MPFLRLVLSKKKLNFPDNFLVEKTYNLKTKIQNHRKKTEFSR